MHDRQSAQGRARLMRRLVLVLSLGALEILAARGVSDADVPGAAAVHVWTAH